MDAKPVRLDSMDELLRTDVATRYKATHSVAHEEIAAQVIEADHAALMRDGFVVLPSLLDAAALSAIKAQAARHLGPTGRTTFEGEPTQRVYNVFSKMREIDALAEHPRVLALLDRLLLPNYLLSQAQLINILAQSPAQLLHFDDGAYPLPRPRPALSAATVWAIDAFTASNGATVVAPGSHAWGDGRVPTAQELVPCVMPAGSVVVFLGTLWHGGGENRSGPSRLAVTCQYCEPWLRQQESFLLEISRDRAAGMSENMRRMIGYSIHPPFWGMVDGLHPKRLLEDAAPRS